MTVGAGTPPPNLDPLRGSSPQGEGENPDLAAPPGQAPHRVKCPVAGSSVGRLCGAKARAGPPCQAPAMANGRCRIHGGTSTGPRTAAGLARLAAAHTTRGTYSAANWVNDRHVRAQARRGRLLGAAWKLGLYLPREVAARLAVVPAELRAPVHPSNIPYLEIATKTLGSGGPDVPGRCAADAFSAPRVRAAALAAARAERAALAPWRAAIAAARLAKREALATRRVARIGKHDKDPRAKDPAARLPGAGLGAGGLGSVGGLRPGGAFGQTGRVEELGRGPLQRGAVGVAGSARMGKHDKDPMPMERLPGAGLGARAAGISAATEAGGAAALATKGGAACEVSVRNPLNSGAGGGTAAADAILAALPNRAARRRWKSLQRRGRTLK
ncbi:MAG TPA: HGGxSTG domain-containing protein [Candidatus Binataceae bacterium]|nr:HGGxSTG domain-containing protein [Candidatus Binataceae bacterium]